MGGHDAGEVASAMVVETLANCTAYDNFEDRVADVVAALEAVNASLITLGRSSIEPRTIGSTVVALLADGGKFSCLWVGDSRAYRLRDGAIVQLTRDHSLVQALVEAGMIEADEAETHPDANVVTRAIGAANALDVETVAGDLCSGDLFLLASDGLTRLVAKEELLAQIAGRDLQQAADGLIDLALARGGPDNVSLILVRFE
jgi:serine/threonine protein phosphatase PrpC